MKIAVFLSRFPYPLIKGDKLRAYNQIVQLAKHHEVYLFCLTRSSIAPSDIACLQPFCKQIELARLNPFVSLLNVLRSLFSRLPFQVSFYRSNKVKRQYDAFLTKYKPDVCYHQFVRTAPYAEALCIPSVLDFQDTLSANMFRRAEKSKLLSQKFFFIEAERLKRYEEDMFALFDRTTIITDADRELLSCKRKNEVAIVSNGVSDKYVAAPESIEKKYDVLFCGNMGYKPNIVAALYLLKTIMPLVRAKRPQTTLCIAGVNPPKEVKRFASKLNVIVEKVPDMRQMYLQSRVFVAPMQIGTGLQNKLLEAMVCKIPSITSCLANKALMAKDNEQIMIANSESEYAKLIMTLLEDQSLSQTLATNAREYILENFRWEKCNEVLESVLLSASKTK